MKKSYLLFILFIFQFLSIQNSYPLQIKVGKQLHWQNVYLKNAQYIRGKDGSFDVVLRENEYMFDNTVDLLVHFNGTDNMLWREYLSGHYELKQKYFTFDKRIKVFGESSGRFAQPGNTLMLRPRHTSWFNQTQHAGSFTIEFWLRPATLSDGQIVFQRYGPVIENGVATKYSGIICRVKNRRLNWEFHHFFHYLNQRKQGEQQSSIQITSRQRLLMNRWRHHAITFDRNSGKLTYYIDGKEDHSIFVTESGQAEDTVLTPRFYPQERSMLVIGQKYFGFIDEFMISKISKTSKQKILRYGDQFRGNGYFNTEKYTSRGGMVVSTIYDLNQTGSYLKKVKINSEQYRGTYINLEYRMSNHFFTHDKPEAFLPWKSLDVRSPYKSNFKNYKGRYFQWRAVLHSSGNGKYTPTLKDIQFEFSIDKNPFAPRRLIAYSQNSKVFLKWASTFERDVVKYKIYYGVESGNYLEGKKPIVINVNQLSDKYHPVFTINHLIVNRVYYFVITAVDRNGHESEASNEVYVRVRKER